MAITPDTYSRLRSTLLDCWQLDGTRQLSSLFADPRLRPWRHTVPETGTVAASVDAIINLLQERQRADDDRNALALFLEVLADRIDPGDACHGQLLDMARQLEEELAQGPPPGAHQPPPLGELNRMRLLGLLKDHFSEEDLRDLSFYLDGLDFDDLPGRGKSAKAREMVQFLQRRGRLQNLVESGRELRPDVPWDEAYR